MRTSYNTETKKVQVSDLRINDVIFTRVGKTKFFTRRHIINIEQENAHLVKLTFVNLQTMITSTEHFVEKEI